MRIAALVALLTILGVALVLFLRNDAGDATLEAGFVEAIIDADGPRAPWGKAVGDVDGDGDLDIVVGGHGSGNLLLYSGPDWARTEIAAGHRFSTDHAVADVTGDGEPDIVSLTDDAVLIFEGPDWQESVLSSAELHDVETADLDGDGDIDVVGRDQSAFGGEGQIIHVFENLGDGGWSSSSIEVIEGEGLAVADLNGDGLTDIVVNNYWLENPGSANVRGWRINRYADEWDWPHTIVGVADIDSDSRPDIVLAPAEMGGVDYRLSWFRHPEDVSLPWAENVIDDSVETVQHSLLVFDADMDGAVDVITAEMHQGSDPDELAIYLNRGGGASWERRVLGDVGSHGIRAGDMDGDGDTDFIGANWDGPDQAVRLWRNEVCHDRGREWRRVLIDPEMPYRSLFVMAGNLDGDDVVDVVAGSRWYRRTGKASNAWEARRILEEPFHAALLVDADSDGDLDIFGTAANGTEPSGELIYASNDGTGGFSPVRVGSVDGDFLQGIAEWAGAGARGIVLSWHQRDSQLHMIQFAQDMQDARTSVLADQSTAQNEAISVADLNRDGRLDIVLGTRWLASSESGFEVREISSALTPDRNVVADIDGDGWLDIVIGSEAISKEGAIAWYRNPAGNGEEWQESLVAEIIGPMSLDAADVDGDGDVDLVAGEHNLSQPDRARAFLFVNEDGLGTRWRQETIHVGDEHHDGTQFVDIDGDGDLDVLSIGWTHKGLVLYENLESRCAVATEPSE